MRLWSCGVRNSLFILMCHHHLFGFNCYFHGSFFPQYSNANLILFSYYIEMFGLSIDRLMFSSTIFFPPSQCLIPLNGRVN